MSYGRAPEPCKQYRPWKGQEPLCGNCAWTEEGHKLQPHQERVIAEKKELDGKIDKLKAFIMESPVYKTLLAAEQNRLNRQYDIMMMYSRILAERIGEF